MLELTFGLSLVAFGLALLSLVISISQMARQSRRDLLSRLPVAPEETTGLMFGVPTEASEVEELRFVPCTCGTGAVCKIHRAARC